MTPNILPPTVLEISGPIVPRYGRGVRGTAVDEIHARICESSAAWLILRDSAAGEGFDHLTAHRLHCALLLASEYHGLRIVLAGRIEHYVLAAAAQAVSPKLLFCTPDAYLPVIENGHPATIAICVARAHLMTGDGPLWERVHSAADLLGFGLADALVREESLAECWDCPPPAALKLERE